MDGLETFVRIRCGVYVLLWGIGMGEKVRERKRGRKIGSMRRERERMIKMFTLGK